MVLAKAFILQSPLTSDKIQPNTREIIQGDANDAHEETEGNMPLVCTPMLQKTPILS